MDDFYRDNERDDISDSTYSYSYSDLNSSVHEGDYDARFSRKLRRIWSEMTLFPWSSQ